MGATATSRSQKALGIKNIHIHKGPTIYPLNRDAFDVADVDQVATLPRTSTSSSSTSGLPRLEDFCWIATQEPNVYGGLAVAMPFMHSRPRYFAQIIGELLYWIGSHWITFASDYAICKPKWLVEMFVDFQIPEDMQSEYGVLTSDHQEEDPGGSTPPSSTTSRVPAELQLADAGEPDGVEVAARRRRRCVSMMTAAVLCAEADVLDGTGRRSSIPSWTSRSPTSASSARSSSTTAASTVHLRLPTSFCSPNFAYLMASDALDALRRAGLDVGEVRGRCSTIITTRDMINSGLAADAGYLGTFGDEAEEGLAELRDVFWRKAHAAAMERAIGSLLRQTPMDVERIGRLTLRDLPEGKPKAALLRRRFAIGLGNCPNSRVLVDDAGKPIPLEAVPLRLRFAKSVRISMEGNGHFCRGLLATPLRRRRGRGRRPRHHEHQNPRSTR